MSVTRGLALTALCILPWSLCGLAAESSAQVYEAARRSLDLSPDPIARSPRLLGMGRLTLADDLHNRINLWDFAGNPAGVLDADSTSTLDLRPASSSSAGRYAPSGSDRERQYVASRELRLGYEAWRRTEDGNAYGFYGDAATLRMDHPFGDQSALRGQLQQPRIVGLLNGKMPLWQAERMRYAITAFFGAENRTDEYRTLFSNANGDYLGKKSDQLPSPDLFTPDEYRVSTLGGSAAISYRAGSWLTAAIGGGGSSSRIEGENSNPLHSSGTGEDRPYYSGQGSLIGRIGPSFEWGADGRAWTSASEERWVFTLKAGINQEPFAGRGKMLDRDESGTEGRFRARWKHGRFEANAGAGRWRREIEVIPPDPLDRSSFNYFIYRAATREGADSLALPDSIRHNRSQERVWDAAGGATWNLSRGLVGVEYHYGEQEFGQTLTGKGPQRRTWDVRSGVEYACTRAFTGRLGYVYRSDDRDLLTQRNEFTSHAVTAGFGLTPAGSMWSVDLGWGIEWLSPDFDDATDSRESRQQMAAQIRWVF